jgi:hypothetical protein
VIRVRDNPPPVDLGGGLRKYFGPARNRPDIRVYQLWAYAGIRHRATTSDFWFRMFCACANALQFAGGFHCLDEAEAAAAYTEVVKAHQRRHHPYEPREGGDDEE